MAASNGESLMIQAQLQSSADGAIVFDAAVASKFDPRWFDADYWRAQSRSDDVQAGRGGVSYVRAPFGDCVLRHYRRGGMVARVMGDRYLWTGAERTRGFAEFRLLADLSNRGMHVPVPVAARYRKQGVHYRADLITRRLANTQELAEFVVQGRCDKLLAQKVGVAIAEFHAAGVYHADLNAHNILLDGALVWLVDFDRGELRRPARIWQLANLSRLKRSMLKLGAADVGADAAFENVTWSALMHDYEQRFAQLIAQQDPRP
ncbi:MAG TPA: 3-deoxy-D-manno-octulosonic acid kinase [Rudaea sp.]|nr:3-deoxy-D-manno-octulosonic acid kinase [Rudaea sp.]